MILTFPEGIDPTLLTTVDSSASTQTYALSLFLHERHSPHDSAAALLYAPPYVFVSLPRFTNTGNKQHRRLTGLQDDLQLPVWTRPNTKTFVHYQPISGLFHIGRAATSGHYRSFLLSPVVLVGDDSHPGAPPTAQEQAQLESGAYLLLLRRQP